MSSQKIQTLQSIPLFAALGEEELAEVAGIMKEEVFKEGVAILTEGKPGKALFVIREGTVRITTREGETDVLLAELGAGKYFGEMSLISGKPASATVTTAERTRFFVIQREDFEEVIRANSLIILYFARELSQRLGETNSKLRKRAAELASLNTELEQRVREKTREIRSIFDHIDQAILTVDEKGIVQPEYSRFSERIFESPDIDGHRLSQILDSDLEDWEPEDWDRFVEEVFAAPGEANRLCREQLPDRLVEYPCQTRDGRHVVKQLRVNALPVWIDSDDGESPSLRRLMFIFRDETEASRLQQELKEREKDLTESVNEILTIISADRELFCDFLDEAEENLERVEALVGQSGFHESEEAIEELYREVHTIKGNARIFKLVRMGETAHELEDTFQMMREGRFDPTHRNLAHVEELVSELFRLHRTARSYLTNISTVTDAELPDELSQEKKAPIGRVAADDLSVRVPMEKLNELNQLVSLLDANDPDFALLKDEIEGLRYVPADRLFKRFPRLVRDLAEQLGKKAELETEAGDTLVDRYVLENLSEPMVHLVRNAVDHGLEPPDVRRAAGKNPTGTLRLRAENRDRYFMLEFSDDGRGIDPEKVRRAAIEKGVVTPEEATGMSKTELQNLLFRSGFSTKEEVTDIAGRGVGLDAIRTVVEELGGRIELQSEPGRGSLFRIFIES